MGRLIDADRLKAHYCWWAGGSKEMTIDEAKKTFDTIIDVQPTVDAVEVVRCKDCESWGLNAIKKDEKDEVIYGDCLHFCVSTPKGFIVHGEKGEKMPRLIDAEHLKKRASDTNGDCWDNYGQGTADFLEYIDNEPTVDAEPVRHGHWEDCSNGWMCSACHHDVSKETVFCPNCGAKMDEVEDE